MDRINILKTDELEGTSYRIGHFDLDKATQFEELREWDGENMTSTVAGKQAHQMLLRTAQGRWVLNKWSQWVGIPETYEYVSDDQAREWLLINKRDADVEIYFGEIEEERGPGRPETVGGKPTNIKLGDDLTEQIKQRAQDGEPFAATVRRLLTVAVQATPPTDTIL